jgi:hypothetical protein
MINQVKGLTDLSSPFENVLKREFLLGDDKKICMRESSSSRLAREHSDDFLLKLESLFSVLAESQLHPRNPD